MIGRDEDDPSEDRPKIRPMDMIGQDEDGLSEVRPKVRLKDMIGRDEDGPSEVPPKESDWTKKESGPYDDASNLYVLTKLLRDRK